MADCITVDILIWQIYRRKGLLHLVDSSAILFYYAQRLDCAVFNRCVWQVIIGNKMDCCGLCWKLW